MFGMGKKQAPRAKSHPEAATPAKREAPWSWSLLREKRA
jgi:hypothetical protein